MHLYLAHVHCLIPFCKTPHQQCPSWYHCGYYLPQLFCWIEQPKSWWISDFPIHSETKSISIPKKNVAIQIFGSKNQKLIIAHISGLVCLPDNKFCICIAIRAFEAGILCKSWIGKQFAYLQDRTSGHNHLIFLGILNTQKISTNKKSKSTESWL